MKIILTMFFLLASSLTAFSATELNCMWDCTDKGYSRAFCKNQCSYEHFPTHKSMSRTDLTCRNDCTDKGYMFSYCTQLCSY